MRKRKCRRVALAAAAVALGLVPVLSSSLPALAATSTVADPLSGTGSLDGSATPQGERWVSPGTVLARTSTGAAMVNATSYVLWQDATLTMTGGDGQEQATVHFAAADVNGDTGVGQAVRLIFRGGSGVYLTLTVKCAGSGGFTRFSKFTGGNEVGIGESVAGPGCGANHVIKVVYVGAEWTGYIDGAAVVRYLDHDSGVAATNPGVGIGLFHNVSSSAAGLVVSDYSAQAGDAGGVPTPYYACGRTIRDVGGGQFFVDLEAANSDHTADKPYTDTNADWVFSWRSDSIGVPEAIFPGSSKITLGLPPVSTMPAGGWTATFEVTRTLNPGVAGAPPAASGSWHVIQPPGKIPSPPKPWYVSQLIWDYWQHLSPNYGIRSHPGGDYLPEAVYLEDGGGQALESPGPWAVARGECTVYIDPTAPESGAAGHTGPAPGPASLGATTTTTAPVGSTTTTALGATTTTVARVPATPSTQGEDGTKADCSAGFLGRVPIIGGLFDSVARLVCSMKQLFLELFVPSDLGHYGADLQSAYAGGGTGSFFAPVSALVGIGGAFSSGYSGGGCTGPVINLPTQLAGGFQFKPLNACDEPMATFAGVVRVALSAVMYIGGALFLFRVFMVVSGLGGGLE